MSYFRTNKQKTFGFYQIRMCKICVLVRIYLFFIKMNSKLIHEKVQRTLPTCVETVPQKLNEFLKKQTLSKWSLRKICHYCCDHGYDYQLSIHSSDILPIISNLLIRSGYQKVYNRLSFFTNDWSDEYTCESPSKVRQNLGIMDPTELLSLIKQNRENYSYPYTNSDVNNPSLFQLSHNAIDSIINKRLNEYIESFGFRMLQHHQAVAWMRKEDWDNIGSYLQAKYNRCSLHHSYRTLEMNILD
jgi:hypothetical protein